MPIPWRSVSVEIYRYRQIGILFYSRHCGEREFTNAIDFIRRAGTGHDDEGFRHVYAPAAGGNLRLIELTEIDWTGLDDALAVIQARRAA